MKLRTTERDYYVLDITSDPALVGTWQASFDDGTTWVDGTVGAEGWVWLLAGPDFVAADHSMSDGDTDATITASVAPLLRIADDPVLDVESGPYIALVTN